MSKELAALGADTANQQAGGPSFLSQTKMFLGTSVLSGYQSVYNTVVEYSNLAGADLEKMDISRKLEFYDDEWFNYYKQNKNIVDVTGFVASSIVPGTLAIKGLKVAQTGANAGAIGRSVGGVLNTFNRRRNDHLAAGLQQIANEGGSAFAFVNSHKYAAMGWGVAEQVLQGAAFETGALLALNQSPMLADSSRTDIMKDFAFGMFVGGAFGGAIDGFVTNRLFKDVVGDLGFKQRFYDTPKYFTRDGKQFNKELVVGDEAYGFADSMLKVPQAVLDNDELLRVRNPFNKQPLELKIGEHLRRSLTAAEKDMVNGISTVLQRLGTEATPEAGQAIADWAFKIIRKGKAAGDSPEAIKDQVGNMLLGMKSVRTLDDVNSLRNFDRDDLFYIAHEVDLGTLAAGKNTVEQFLELARARTPFAKNATAKPYEVVGSLDDVKMTTSFKQFQLAWDDGFDMAIIGGKMRINPKSPIFRQVTDPLLIPQRFWNSRTGGVSDVVHPTWADKLPTSIKDVKSQILAEGVLYGKQIINTVTDFATEDTVTATARHAWASTLTPAYFANRTVDAGDISLLTRLEELGLAGNRLKMDELGISIKLGEGNVVNASSQNLTELLADAKLARMNSMMNENAGGKLTRDMREVAYVTNSSEEWLERAMANGYQRTSDDTLLEGISESLEQNLKRENFIVTWSSPRVLPGLGVTTQEALDAAEAAAKQKGAHYADTFITGELGFANRVMLSENARKNAFGATFPQDAPKFFDFNERELILHAGELGAGAGAITFANASYGQKMELFVQHIGKLVHQMIPATATPNLEKLNPYIAIFQNDLKAGAELGVVMSMIRRTADKFVLIKEGGMAGGATDGIHRLVVRDITFVDKADGIRKIDSSKHRDWTNNPDNRMSDGSPGKAVFDIDSPKVTQFLLDWRQMNGERLGKRQTLLASRGMAMHWDPDVIYMPPINTEHYPFFALVKVKKDHIMGGSDVGMITAKSAAELSTLSKEIDADRYDVFFKNNTEEFYKVKHEFNAQMSMNEPRVNSELRKSGKLGDHFYEVRPENIMEDFIRYSQNADTSLVRLGVDTRYAQLITELQALSSKYREVATSQFSGKTRQYDTTKVDPFNDYIHTALDISKRSGYPVISKLNEFVDGIGTGAYRHLFANTQKARDGLISWQEAERIATKYGIGGVYNAGNVESAFAIANRPMDRNLLRETVSKVNNVLGTVGLRLDTANALVNVISLPITFGTEFNSLAHLAKKNPEAIGALRRLYTVPAEVGPNLPPLEVPSMLKLIGTAMNNIYGKDGATWLKKYAEFGDIKDIQLQFHEMMGEMAIRPDLGLSGWSKFVDKAVEKGSKWSGNNFAEDLTRALSANVMDQLTAPLVRLKLLSSQEADAYRSVFVNRVNGNYIASQRPILFQGTVGAAVSLFQTYIFNVMQQMTRHIEDRNLRALLTMGGLQGAIYGFNGLPFFDAVNTHLIGNAAINDGHRDVYSATTQLAGEGMGNWLLYGTASAFPLFNSKMPALYTRGDINPRHITILPVSPMDVPAVAVTGRVLSNIVDTLKKGVGGADITATFLEGLEHNGISRPLAGLAQLVQGYTTTGKGSLVSASNDIDITMLATRMIGARPMDEAVGLNALFRSNAYKAADLERLAGLGEIVKTKLRRNQMPTDDEMFDFAKKYASVGGNLQNYTGAIQRWSRDANMSVVEKMKRYHNSNSAMRLSEIMSGITLEDFRNTPPTTEPPTQ